MRQCPFSERFLQIIWNERLLVPQAKCTDNREIRILSVGLWNRMAGPDFHDAAVVIDNTLLRGDIEVHRFASEWHSHGHGQDPRYDKVVLHVVWIDDHGGPVLPTLELQGQLQSSWGRLFQQVEAACYPYGREVPPGACALRWALSDDESLRTILSSAGLSRMLRRGQRLLRLGAQVGEDQALYEQTFEGLGYAFNRQPFRQLAQALPLSACQDACRNESKMMALFLGTAGLLPDPTQVEILPEFRTFVSMAWRHWWASGQTSIGLKWNRNGTRPLNSIERRLAGGVFWLHACQSRPGCWLRECVEQSKGTPRQLLRLLTIPLKQDPQWEKMLNFETRLARPAALLGRERMVDLALNTFLPYLAAKAEMDHDDTTRQLAQDTWELIPCGQENHLLKDAVRRFLSPPSRARELLRNASQQQGMLDIFQNFCLALDHSCAECPFVTMPSTDK
ncbi:MAG: DUF2851 family protein [Victivallales bacterium]|nr:DUF2851 family protein [Victivallales bacterium]